MLHPTLMKFGLERGVSFMDTVNNVLPAGEVSVGRLTWRAEGAIQQASVFAIIGHTSHP